MSSVTLHPNSSGPMLPGLYTDGSFEAIERRIQSLFPNEGIAEAVPSLAAQGTNYLICYVPRSGSTHLISLLQNTGLMGKPADFFNIEYANLPRDEQHILEVTGIHTICWARESYGVQSVAQYLDFVARSTRTRNGVFGLKADFYHASVLMRRKLFSDTQTSNKAGSLGWKYIYVTREDLLMQAISYYRADRTGSWTSIGAAGRPKCEFDETRILASLECLADFMRKWEILFARLGIQPLRLSYEELESDPRSVVQRVMRFVGVKAYESPDALPIVSRFEKQRDAESVDWAAKIVAAVR
jgi:trehalose 2-sulfotransferase